jgi:hypothetical protein
MNSLVQLQTFLYNAVPNTEIASDIFHACVIFNECNAIDIDDFNKLFPFGEQRANNVLKLLEKKQYVALDGNFCRASKINALFEKADDHYSKQENPILIVF